MRGTLVLGTQCVLFRSLDSFSSHHNLTYDPYLLGFPAKLLLSLINDDVTGAAIRAVEATTGALIFMAMRTPSVMATSRDQPPYPMLAGLFKVDSVHRFIFGTSSPALAKYGCLPHHFSDIVTLEASTGLKAGRELNAYMHANAAMHNSVASKLLQWRKDVPANVDSDEASSIWLQTPACDQRQVNANRVASCLLCSHSHSIFTVDMHTVI